ncbi:MAG: FHA domain-containing protein, partial [Candidatus Omnitrophica bacterium]|nr:FHA domain-containing protein [Candidatus Omnitrophota bacterium]
MILIQDAHAVLDAQNNIRKLIQYFQEKYGIRLVTLEGARGRIDTVLLRTFPDKFIKKKVLNQYLERGELSGSDMAAIFSAKGGSSSGGNLKEAVYSGIEEWDLYEKNYIAYLQAFDVKADVLARIKEISRSLDREREKVYSPALKEFHERSRAFEEERSHLVEFLQYLKKFSRNDSRTAPTVTFAEKYPQIATLTESLDVEESLRGQALDSSIRSMADSFKRTYVSRLDKTGQKRFNGDHQAYLSGQMEAGAFLRSLVDTAQSIRVKLKLSSLMKVLLGNSKTFSMIQGTRLFEELEMFTREIEDGLAAGPAEKEIVKTYRRLELLRNLAVLELTRDQLEQYQKDPEGYLVLLGNERDKIAPAIEFYRWALERDQAFFENLKSCLGKEKADSAILVAGGFHTRSLQAILKSRGYSYLVVAPAIDSLQGGEIYHQAMHANLSYKSYLKTTFYDAFMRHAMENLMRESKNSDFVTNLKFWRDEVIRHLSQEGKITEVGEYTKYIDLLYEEYRNQSDKGSKPEKTQEGILKDVSRELNQFHAKTMGRLWERFQAQMAEFSKGLRELMDSNQVNQENISALIDRASQVKTFNLGPFHALARGIPGSGSVLFEFNRSEGRVPPRVETLEVENIPANVDLGKLVPEALDAMGLSNIVTPRIENAAREATPAVEELLQRQIDRQKLLPPEVSTVGPSPEHVQGFVDTVKKIVPMQVSVKGALTPEEHNQAARLALRGAAAELGNAVVPPTIVEISADVHPRGVHRAEVRSEAREEGKDERLSVAGGNEWIKRQTPVRLHQDNRQKIIKVNDVFRIGHNFYQVLGFDQASITLLHFRQDAQTKQIETTGVKFRNEWKVNDNIRSLTLGRNAKKVDIIVDESTASREHARIILDGKRLILEDLGSKNNTWFYEFATFPHAAGNVEKVDEANPWDPFNNDVVYSLEGHPVLPFGIKTPGNVSFLLLKPEELECFSLDRRPGAEQFFYIRQSPQARVYFLHLPDGKTQIPLEFDTPYQFQRGESNRLKLVAYGVSREFGAPPTVQEIPTEIPVWAGVSRNHLWLTLIETHSGPSIIFRDEGSKNGSAIHLRDRDPLTVRKIKQRIQMWRDLYHEPWLPLAIGPNETKGFLFHGSVHMVASKGRDKVFDKILSFDPNDVERLMEIPAEQFDKIAPSMVELGRKAIDIPEVGRIILRSVDGLVYVTVQNLQRDVEILIVQPEQPFRSEVRKPAEDQPEDNLPAGKLPKSSLIPSIDPAKIVPPKKEDEAKGGLDLVGLVSAGYLGPHAQENKIKRGIARVKRAMRDPRIFYHPQWFRDVAQKEGYDVYVAAIIHALASEDRELRARAVLSLLSRDWGPRDVDHLTRAILSRIRAEDVAGALQLSYRHGIIEHLLSFDTPEANGLVKELFGIVEDQSTQSYVYRELILAAQKNVGKARMILDEVSRLESDTFAETLNRFQAEPLVGLHAEHDPLTLADYVRMGDLAFEVGVIPGIPAAGKLTAVKGEPAQFSVLFPGSDPQREHLHSHPGGDPFPSGYATRRGGVYGSEQYRGDLFSIGTSRNYFIISSRGITKYYHDTEDRETPRPHVVRMEFPGGEKIDFQAVETSPGSGEFHFNMNDPRLFDRQGCPRNFVARGLLGPNGEAFKVTFISWESLVKLIARGQAGRVNQFMPPSFLDATRLNPGDTEYLAQKLSGRLSEGDQRVLRGLEAVRTPGRALATREDDLDQESAQAIMSEMMNAAQQAPPAIIRLIVDTFPFFDMATRFELFLPLIIRYNYGAGVALANGMLHPDRSFHVRRSASRGVVQTAELLSVEDTNNFLRKGFDDPDHRVREAALEFLGRARAEADLVQFLERALREDLNTTRIVALTGGMNLSAEVKKEYFLRYLRSNEEYRRYLSRDFSQDLFNYAPKTFFRSLARAGLPSAMNAEILVAAFQNLGGFEVSALYVSPYGRRPFVLEQIDLEPADSLRVLALFESGMRNFFRELPPVMARLQLEDAGLQQMISNFLETIRNPKADVWTAAFSDFEEIYSRAEQIIKKLGSDDSRVRAARTTLNNMLELRGRLVPHHTAARLLWEKLPKQTVSAEAAGEVVTAAEPSRALAKPRRIRIQESIDAMTDTQARRTALETWLTGWIPRINHLPHGYGTGRDQEFHDLIDVLARLATWNLGEDFNSAFLNRVFSRDGFVPMEDEVDWIGRVLGKVPLPSEDAFKFFQVLIDRGMDFFRSEFGFSLESGLVAQIARSRYLDREHKLGILERAFGDERFMSPHYGSDVRDPEGGMYWADGAEMNLDVLIEALLGAKLPVHEDMRLLVRLPIFYSTGMSAMLSAMVRQGMTIDPSVLADPSAAFLKALKTRFPGYARTIGHYARLKMKQIVDGEIPDRLNTPGTIQDVVAPEQRRLGQDRSPEATKPTEARAEMRGTEDSDFEGEDYGPLWEEADRLLLRLTDDDLDESEIKPLVLSLNDIAGRVRNVFFVPYLLSVFSRAETTWMDQLNDQELWRLYLDQRANPRDSQTMILRQIRMLERLSVAARDPEIDLDSKIKVLAVWELMHYEPDVRAAA